MANKPTKKSESQHSNPGPLYEYKKTKWKRAELPKRNPILNLEQFAEHFQSIAHYHEIFHAKSSGRSLYVQYLGPTTNADSHNTTSRFQGGTSSSQSQSKELTNLSQFKMLLSKHLRAVVILLHGYSDHSSRCLPYVGLKNLCVENKYVVVGMDCHGHGFSCGERGYVNSIS
eukprot:CAMPEP_0117455320 /NCGR_PEP_ID=MMETSP0759-20121206/11296_1 /TAXON_ID=63605 /ORGANISM="Percolomonas cosmopolitus, Strain WS" /LENGTH=171 /DNA_ID=CAMNT_0005248615 /DNA_START=735 /DNA_END=1246 /DNA_ORIENTATION=+